MPTRSRVALAAAANCRGCGHQRIRQTALRTRPCSPRESNGHEEPQRDAMIASAEGFIRELSHRYPAIRTRNSIYSFSDFERSFANSLGVRQSERRGRYGFGAGFCGKDGRRTTSVDYSGAASFEPFERLLGVGTVQRLIDETLRSFERKPVPGKFVGDVIITPDCLRSLMGSITNALSGSALFAGMTPYKGRKGEQIASEKFSLLNRPRSPEFPGGADFDGFGVPTKDLDVVKDGVLNEFLIGFFMARKLGVPTDRGRLELPRSAGRCSDRRNRRQNAPWRRLFPLFRRAAEQQSRLLRGREEFLLCRGRRGETRARRNDGERQFPGASDNRSTRSHGNA